MQVKGTIDINSTLGYHRVRLQPLLQAGERELVSQLALADTVVATAQCFPTQKVDCTLRSILETSGTAHDTGILFQNRSDAEQFVRDLHEGITGINATLSQKANDTRASMLIDQLLSVSSQPKGQTDREHEAIKAANRVETAKEDQFAKIALTVFIVVAVACLVGFLRSC